MLHTHGPKANTEETLRDHSTETAEVFPARWPSPRGRKAGTEGQRPWKPFSIGYAGRGPGSASPDAVREAGERPAGSPTSATSASDQTVARSPRQTQPHLPAVRWPSPRHVAQQPTHKDRPEPETA